MTTAPSRRFFHLPSAPVVALAALVSTLLVLAVGASASSAETVWSASFESQTWNPWQGVQYEYHRPMADSFAFVTSPVRTGRYAAEFVARQGYAYGSGEGAALCCGPKGEGAAGNDEWWAWSTYFPLSWVQPYRWGLFFQFHAGPRMPPPIAFDAGGDAAWVQVRTGNVDPSTGTWSYGRFPKILDTLSKGRWNDFVVHVRWAVGSNGVLEVWHRLAGQSRFAKVLGLSGIPTLQSEAGSSDGIYAIAGLYRGSYCAPAALGCTGPLGVQATNTLYEDSFARGSSFGAVVDAAWSPGPPAAPAPGAQQRPRPAANTLGNPASGAASDPGRADYLDASGPYALTRAALLTSLTGLVSGERSPMSVRGVVYADRDGRPGALVATTSQVVVAAGAPAAWLELPLPAPVALRPGKYWLGYWYGPGAGTGGGGFRFAAAHHSEAYSSAPYSAARAAPRLFPPAASSASRYALYARYVPSSLRKHGRRHAQKPRHGG